MIYPLKMVIFHSYVALPSQSWKGVLMGFYVMGFLGIHWGYGLNRRVKGEHVF
jgi:hypothetical protein